MTPVDVKRTEQTILRDVLHIIATNTEPERAVPPVLETAQHITQASGACLLLFNEPRLRLTVGINEDQLPPDEAFKTASAQLPEGFHVHPALSDSTNSAFAQWLLAPIRVNQKVVGIFWLVFDQAYQLTEEHRALLMALLDGLTIVTVNARSKARHEKLMRNQYEFTRIVSHDLRSPMTSMQGFASMLESGTWGELSEKQAYYVEKILSGITQMTSLVDNIQDAGRYDPETGFYEMNRSQVDLVDIVRRIVNNHLVPAEKGELTISVQTADDVPILNADPIMLERAIINLVDNAIKYTPNGGKIEVAVKRQGNKVIASVKDDGYGISPENQRNLFERHVRIPRKEHKKVKGSGLGLFIVRSVAQRHGGDAWVESSEGAGSTFCFSIPLEGANLIGAESTGS